MKVLVVSQYFWPENFIINNLLQILRGQGLEITVMTGKPNYPDGKIYEGYNAGGFQREDHEGVTILRLPIVARGKRSRVKLVLNYLSFIFSGFLFAPHLLKDRDYDLVFVYAPSPLLQALPAILLARCRKVPLVVWVQDLWPESLSATGHVNNRWILGAVARVVRLIYRASNRILVQSRAFIEPVTVLTDRPEKIYYYPNLYHAHGSRQCSARASHLIQILTQHFCVVFAGNLGSFQALDTLIEVARRLQPHAGIRMVLVGSGSQDDWLAQQRDAHGLINLILVGRYGASDMPAIFDAAQALLVSLRPDPALRLTVPSKVQAYLAAGRPILAALDGEGARIVQESGAGLCSPAGDASALVKNVLQLVAMPPLERQQMGVRGRTYFEQHFAPDTLAAELIEHFKALISKTEGSA